MGESAKENGISQTKDTTHCLIYLRPAASAASSVSIQQANRSDINPSWTNDGITSSIGSITNGRAALNDCLHGPKQVTTRRIGDDDAQREKERIQEEEAIIEA